MTIYNGFHLADLSTPSSSSFLKPTTIPRPSHNRGNALIAAYAITVSLAVAAAARRYFVRYTRSQSSRFRMSVFIVEDYILLFSVSCICAFTALGIYGCVNLGWGYMENTDWTVEAVEESWRVMYAAQIISNVFMTTIRLDLFSFFRRIYARTNSRCRFCCVAMIILSLSYLIVAIPIGTTLSCGPAYPTSPFDLWAFVAGRCYTKASERLVRIALQSVEGILDLTVLGMVMKTVWTLSNQEEKRNPGMLVKQAGKPCRPMCAMAFSACVPAFIHIKFAATRDEFDFNARVMGLICTQIEGALFIFVSCAPMLRTLVCPSSQLGVSKNSGPYNGSSGCTNTIGGGSKPRSRSASVAKPNEKSRRGSNAAAHASRCSKSIKCSRRSVVTWSVTVIESDALSTTPSPVDQSMPTHSPGHARKPSNRLSEVKEGEFDSLRRIASADGVPAHSNMHLGVVETIIRAVPEGSSVSDYACSSMSDEEEAQEADNHGFEFGFSARDAVAGTLARTRSLLGSVAGSDRFGAGSRASDRLGAGSRASARHSARESQTTIVVADLEPLELREGSDSRLDMSDVGIDMFPMPGDSAGRSIVESIEESIRDAEEGRSGVAL